MSSTIFYAWQSDSDEKVNRYFIRDALKAAITSLSRDEKVEEAPRLDHDTKDVPGSPSIVEAILSKITQASVFVADVTLVAKTLDNTLVPNPNVMLELGYAVAKLTDRQVLTVMNEASGHPTLLPFDLAHRRWPITYNLPVGVAPSPALRQEFIGELTRALRIILRGVAPVGRVPAREVYVASREAFARDGNISGKNSEVFAAIRGTVEWRCYPAREGAIRWQPREVLDRMKNAAVSFTGRPFPTVNGSDDQRPQRIADGYLARFVQGPPDHPRLEYWQLHANGFFGIRRQLPEIRGEHRLESLSVFRLLGWIAASLKVAANLYAELAPEEHIVWAFRADGLQGRYLATERDSGWEPRYRCDTLTYGPNEINLPLQTLRATMNEIASEVFTDLYTFFGQDLEPTHFVERVRMTFNSDPSLNL
jgi:hypothetical protein